jgi:histone H3/H4
MEILLTLAVSAVLFLTIEVLWRSRNRSGWRAGTAAPVEDDDTTVEWQLFSLPFVRRRLAALAEELERLDRDPDVFAKAFHTMVARSAYETLSADASRLAEQARRHTGRTLDVELAGPSQGVGEVLEL